jgi:hypothetical protein
MSGLSPEGAAWQTFARRAVAITDQDREPSQLWSREICCWDYRSKIIKKKRRFAKQTVASLSAQSA